MKAKTKARAGILGVTLLGGLALASCGGEKGDKGDPGPAGAMGDKGDGTSSFPEISLLTPASLYAGRTQLVQISGVGTHFTGGSTLDFADSAITAKQVFSGSSANLRVLVEVGLTAQMGAHDVMVMTEKSPTGGDEEHVVLAGGLSVMPALAVELPTGATSPPQVPQGGIVDFSATNLDDRQNPFSALGQGLELASGLLAMSTPTIQPDHFEGLGLVDALAPVGGLQAALTQSDRQGQTLGYVSDPADKNAPQVTARPATLLTSGTAKSGEGLGTPASGLRPTNLYKLMTTADNQVALVTCNALGAPLSVPLGMPGAVSLSGSLAPASGHFRDGHSLETSETPGLAGTVAARSSLLYLPKAGAYYLSIYASDLSGSPSHGYAITASVASGASIGSLREPTPADSPSMPLGNIAMLDKPYYGTDGAADDGFDTDYIRFRASKTGRVYALVQTTPGLPMGLSLYAADCTTAITGNHYSSSGNVLSEADVTNGITYCIRIAGQGQPAPYQFVISH